MKKKVLLGILFGGYTLFLIFSYIFQFPTGKKVGANLFQFSSQIVMLFPFAFILIGLFEVWVKRETIEKHLGENSGFQGYLWAILLGGSTLGPMIVALPVASALYSKGARLSVIFTYIGAAAICRIPMTVFEASYLGIAFTVIRYAVSLPLVILSSVILSRYLTKKNYRLTQK